MKKKCNIPTTITGIFLCHKYMNVVPGVLITCMHVHLKLRGWKSQHLYLKMMLLIMHREWKSIWVGF